MYGQGHWLFVNKYIIFFVYVYNKLDVELVSLASVFCDNASHYKETT